MVTRARREHERRPRSLGKAADIDLDQNATEGSLGHLCRTDRFTFGVNEVCPGSRHVLRGRGGCEQDGRNADREALHSWSFQKLGGMRMPRKPLQQLVFVKGSRTISCHFPYTSGNNCGIHSFPL